VHSGTIDFRPGRYQGGGIRYLRFRGWLDRLVNDTGTITAVHFEEVRRHVGTDAAHLHGGFLATLTAWCEQQAIAYQGVPVGTIKRFATGKGNAGKDAVIAAMRDRGFAPADDNEADALALLLWAIDTDGGVR
jgi:Holliday junction resolvasome RuvABC endonuclease subunit